MSDPSELVMSFDPKTIEHLGVQMYSTLPPVIAEVVANSYDADAENVSISLDDVGQKSIIINDDGHGMLFKDINEKFLTIGRNRRKEDDGERSPKKRRPIIGKKGIGKLSFFGVAKRIEVQTARDGKRNAFVLDWDEIMQSSGQYNPKLLSGKDESTKVKNGTRVILTEILRKSQFDPRAIAISLSRSFSVFGEDFKVKIIHNGDAAHTIDITNELKYESVEEELVWKFPTSRVKSAYALAHRVSGKMISSKKTVPEVMRGVALFSRGKLVNEHSFYNIKATSHGYSYITGWLDVSFVDDWKNKDVISTNRRSLRMEDEDIEDLIRFIEDAVMSFYNEQREVRSKQRIKQIEDAGIHPYRWLEEMPNKYDQKLARKIVDIIVNSTLIEVDKAAELVEYVRGSFQFESFKELAAELQDLEETDAERLLPLLKTWQIIEAQEFYKLSKVRVETIRQFEKYIEENVKEVPTIHSFVKAFPWLLDPRIIEFRDEVRYSQILRDKYRELDVAEKDRRIDFLCLGIANSFFVIELKRPRHIVSEKDISQAADYRSFLEENMFGNAPETRKQVTAYVIGGQLGSDRITRDLMNTYRDSNKVFVKTYTDLLRSAEAYHREFIDRYDEIQARGKLANARHLS
jgi:hypothetical protein